MLPKIRRVEAVTLGFLRFISAVYPHSAYVLYTMEGQFLRSSFLLRDTTFDKAGVYAYCQGFLWILYIMDYPKPYAAAYFLGFLASGSMMSKVHVCILANVFSC
jgi:hypothetical protein